MIKINYNLAKRKGVGGDTPVSIVVVFRWDGNVVRLGTGVSVPQINWDKEKQRIKGKGKGVAYSNLKLSRLYSSLQAAMIDLVKDKIPTKGNVREVAHRVMGKSEDTGERDGGFFDEYFTYFIEDAKTTKSESTAKTYNSIFTLFKKFQGKRRLQFEDLDIHFVKSFEKFLLDKKLSRNYTHKAVRMVRTVLKSAHLEGKHDCLHYQSDGFKVKRGKPKENIYLSLEELDAIRGLELTGMADNIRDLFLIGCYTGQRFSDYSRLDESSRIKLPNGKEAFKLSQVKTKETVIIPIHPIVSQILVKREGGLPRSYHDVVVNRELKKIGRLAGIGGI